MPYIKSEDRVRILKGLERGDDMPRNAGELNFLITSICHKYLRDRAADAKTYTANYQAHNDVVGVLECAKLELYRRKTAPYEDIKIDENGDL